MEKITIQHIIRISFPIILSSATQNIITSTDTIFLGHYGKTELAAVGLIGIFFLVINMMCYGLSRGAQILIARRFGEQKWHDIGVIFMNSIVLSFLFAVVSFMLILFYGNDFISLFIKDNEVKQRCIEFMYYRKFGLFFSSINFCFVAFYTGITQTRSLIFSTIIIALSNIVFNYLFVFGKFGFTEMGIGGSATASSIADVLGTISLLLFTWQSRYLSIYHLFNWRKIHYNLLWYVFQLSLPMVIQYLLGLGAWFIFFSLIESKGVQYLAASNVIKNIYSFWGIITWGMVPICSALASQAFGNDKHFNLFLIIKKVLIANFLFTLPLCGVLLFMPEPILRIFTDDQSIIQLALPTTQLLSLIVITFTISTIVFNTVAGVGATWFSMLFETISVIAYLTYCYFFIVKNNCSLSIAWLSEMAYWLVLLISSLWYLQIGKWREIRI